MPTSSKTSLRLWLLSLLCLLANFAQAQNLIQGTLQSVNASVYTPLPSAPTSLQITVSGAGSWTLAVQTSPDNSTWATVLGSTLSPVGNTAPWGPGATGVWTVPLSSAYTQVVMTTYASGSAQVSLRPTPLAYVSPHLIASTPTDLVSAAANGLALQTALIQASTPSPTLIAPTFDNAVTASTAGAASVTITAYKLFGLNRYLMVAIHYDNATTPVSGVTCGGGAMTLLTSSPAAAAGMDVYGIANPTIGTSVSPNIVVANSNSGVAETVEALSLMGVNSVGAAVVNAGTGTSATNTQLTAVNHLVVDFLTTINGTVTPGSGNIAGPSPNATAPLYATQGNVTQGTVQGTCETLPGAASVAIAYTVPSGAWRSIAFDVQGFSYQGTGVNPATVSIPGLNGGAGPQPTYYFSIPAGNTYAAVECAYLNNVKLLIDPSVTLKIANGANCPIVIAYGCKGFQIEGGTWDGNTANVVSSGNYYNGPANTAYTGLTVWLDNCTDCLITNTRWQNSQQEALFLTFNTRLVVRDMYCNISGTQFNGGNRECLYENVSGYNIDNLVAMVPMDYPMHNVRGGGNIVACRMDGIHGYNCAQEIVRLVGGNNIYGNYGARISNVTGVCPTNVNAVSMIDDATYVQTTGTLIDGAVIDGVYITSQFNTSSYPFVVTGTKIRNVTLRNIHSWNFQSSANVSVVYIGAAGVIDGLRLEDCDMPVSAAFLGTLVSVAGTINFTLSLQNCIVNGNTGSTWMVQCSGGVPDVSFHSCIGLNINGFLNSNSSTVAPIVAAVDCQTPGCVLGFNINTIGGNLRLTSNDFSGITTGVIRNASSSGFVGYRGAGNFWPAAGNLSFIRSASQTNGSVCDSSCQVNGAILTPAVGDEYYNTNAAYGAGIGLYVYGTTATRIGT